jgi:hypothetical protein
VVTREKVEIRVLQVKTFATGMKTSGGNQDIPFRELLLSLIKLES